MKRIHGSPILSILFILGILVMLNAISVRNFLRLDLTSSKMYSLSKVSKKLVGSIEDKLIVKAYFSPNLPPPYNTVSRYLRDMLEDYQAYSKGHLTYEFINPTSEEKLEQETQSFNIPPRQFQTLENDKFEVKMGYMGVVFIYGDKKEVIPVVEDMANLEYEITSLINRLTSKTLPKLGIASTGSEEERVTMQYLYEAIGRNFDIQPVSIDSPIGKEINGVFFIAPRKPLTDWQLFNFDQYIMNGGKLAVFANSYEPFLQQGYASLQELNLNNFLKHYGVTINEDILIDEKSSSISVPRRQGFFTFKQSIRMPYLPVISTFNHENVITRDLGQLQAIFPSSVDTSLAKEKGYVAEGLMYTSEKSGRERGPIIQMDIYRRWTEQDFAEHNIPLAAVVKGKFDSFFAQSGPPLKTVPSSSSADESGQSAETAVKDTTVKGEKYDGPFVTACEDENRIMVVGDGFMALDTYLQDPMGRQLNLLFMQNAADWLVQSESLISIRSKRLALKPLEDIPPVAKTLVKRFNQIGPVILVIIAGVILWQVRRFRKKAFMATN